MCGRCAGNWRGQALTGYANYVPTLPFTRSSVQTRFGSSRRSARCSHNWGGDLQRATRQSCRKANGEDTCWGGVSEVARPPSAGGRSSVLHPNPIFSIGTRKARESQEGLRQPGRRRGRWSCGAPCRRMAGRSGGWSCLMGARSRWSRFGRSTPREGADRAWVVGGWIPRLARSG